MSNMHKRREHKRRVLRLTEELDGYKASLALCESHTPDIWEGDGTCVICEAEELNTLRTAGIIEVAVRNPNVASYMDHWEKRALKAEGEVERLREQINHMWTE